MIRIVVGALLLRLFSASMAFVMNVVIPAGPRASFTVLNHPDPFWDGFARYDSGWYYQIARYGYDAGPAVMGGRSNIAFFPVFPLLMRLVRPLFGHGAWAMYAGGIVLAWGSFVLAMLVLYRLALLDLPPPRAALAVLLAAVFPFAFFYGVVYSESTYLLFTVLGFYLLRTRRWLTGGLAAGVAGATRVNGIMMWPALAWMVARQSIPTTRGRLLAGAALVLAASGFAAYNAYIFAASGQPLLWAVALQRWGYYVGGAPWIAPARLLWRLTTDPYGYLTSDPMAPFETLNGLTAMVFVAAVPFVWRALGTSYALYMAANLWLPLSAGAFEGMGRYCAVLFPFFIWLAGVESTSVLALALVSFGMLYGVCLSLFATAHPMY
jgi:hypothetical protein